MSVKKCKRGVFVILPRIGDSWGELVRTDIVKDRGFMVFENTRVGAEIRWQKGFEFMSKPGS